MYSVGATTVVASEYLCAGATVLVCIAAGVGETRMNDAVAMAGMWRHVVWEALRRLRHQ